MTSTPAGSATTAASDPAAETVAPPAPASAASTSATALAPAASTSATAPAAPTSATAPAASTSATAPARSAAAPSVSLSLGDEITAAATIGGFSPAALAREFGTPLFVYDLDVIGRRVDALRSVLPAGFKLAFAVKSNPALAVVAYLARIGIGADIASGGELATVLLAGFAPASIAMTGPGKKPEELAAAVAAGIGSITVESPGEMRRLEAIAAAAGRRQPILFRLAVREDGRLERFRLIGGAGGGKFGMPLEDLVEAARYAVASPYLEPLGVHAFGASNVLDAAQLAHHAAEIVAIGRDVAVEAGFPLRLVDAGGGLGITYADGEEPLDLAAYGDALADLRARWDADPALRDTEVLLEPGRFLAGPAGAFLARVVDVKGAADAPVAILDGGVNNLVRPALVRQEQRLRLLDGAAEVTATAGPTAGADSSDGAQPAREDLPVDRRGVNPTTVAGPLCTGIDVFGAAAPLAQPRVGDLIAVLDSGAYGFTESMPLFLSHPIPAEVAVRGGQARLIRPRVEPIEQLDRQIAPEW
jgi:diaminopimelate decarboxylase